MTPFLFVNAAMSAITVAFGITGAVRPTSMTRSAPSTFGERFFAWMYAARAVPLGLLAALAPFVFAGRGSALVLFAAATAQLGDAAIGVWRGQRSMIFGGATAAAIHVVSGILVL